MVYNTRRMNNLGAERKKGYQDIFWGRDVLIFPALRHLSCQDDVDNPIVPQTIPMNSKFIDHAICSFKCSSRTFQGIGSNETSQQKLEILSQGPELVDQACQNFRRGVQYFYDSLAFGVFHKSDRGVSILSAAPTIFNYGIIQLEQGPFRTWETPYGHVPPECITAELAAFSRVFTQLLMNPSVPPIPVAAWIEHDLNGRIHPYSDGCGRISRGLSTALLALHEIPRPVFRSRDEQIDAFRQPFEVWLSLYASRIPESLK